MHYRDMEVYDPEGDYLDIDSFKELADMWRELPKDVKDHLTSHAKNLFTVYGPMLKALVVQAYRKMVQRRIPAIPALHPAARKMNIPARNAAVGSRGKLTGTQVKQSQQRMNQRLPSNRSKQRFKTRGY
jgi:hypothetical protein